MMNRDSSRYASLISSVGFFQTAWRGERGIQQRVYKTARLNGIEFDGFVIGDDAPGDFASVGNDKSGN